MSSVAKRKGYSYASNSLRKAFCITSYFRKPEQGISNWEELSRSSAFILRSLNKHAKYHIVSAAHVTHPFLYPRLYPEEFPRFLSFLKESDVKVALQYREVDTGALLSEFWLRRHYSVKTDADLVVGHLEQEKEFEEVMKNKFMTEVDPLILYGDGIPANSEIELIGHDFTLNQNGHTVLVPVTLPGLLLGASNRRAVVDTVEPSVMGLCGGPAVLLDPINGVPSNYVVGMVEGRIQVPSQNSGSDAIRALADRTVLVTAKEISDFLPSVEADMDESFLQLPDRPSFTPSPTPTVGMDPIMAEMLEQNIGRPTLTAWDPSQAFKDKDDDIDL